MNRIVLNDILRMRVDIKCCLIVTFLIFLFHVSIAQKRYKSSRSRERYGYLALTLGPSFPVGKFAAKENYEDSRATTGVNINLVNFGYSFGVVGFTASWYGGSHYYEDGYSTGRERSLWSYGGITVGPMFTILQEDKISVDLRSMFGYMILQNGTHGHVGYNSHGLAFSLGIMCRYNFAKRWCLPVHADFLTSNTETNGGYAAIEKRKVAAVNCNVGIGFRL